MKIQIDGVEILEIDPISIQALHWRLIDPKVWIKNAIIGQISHARDEMVLNETVRIRGKEEGMPASMNQDHLIEWMSSHSTYQTAEQREAEKKKMK